MPRSSSSTARSTACWKCSPTPSTRASPSVSRRQRTGCADRSARRMSVERLARREHLHELFGAAGAGLGLLRLLHAPDECVAVPAVERREELARLPVLV